MINYKVCRIFSENFDTIGSDQYYNPSNADFGAPLANTLEAGESSFGNPVQLPFGKFQTGYILKH